MIVMAFFMLGCSPSEQGDGSYSSDEIYEMASKSVVEITTKDEKNNVLSLGSGFVYAEDGVIVTNYHVIDGAVSAIVKIGTLEYPVNTVQAYDVEKDFYNRNKDFFKKVKTQKEVGETDEK